jgi:hypothetical protein
LRERKVALAAELMRGDVSTVADALRQIETRETELLAKVGPAEDEAAVSLHDTFESAKSLAELLANDPDPADARARLKATLRRVIDRIDVLVLRHNRDRMAFVKVTFRKGGVRVYVIWCEPSRGTSRTARGAGGGRIRTRPATSIWVARTPAWWSRVLTYSAHRTRT